jgi:hypothetical protein
MNRDALDQSLAQSFGGEPAERRVVVRQALDLIDASRWAETHTGAPLTADRIVEELEQSPDDEGYVERWNWWIGSLELADGDYERFAIRQWQSE